MNASQQLPYVGFWWRFLAMLLDTFIILAVEVPLLLLIYGSDYFAGSGSFQGVGDILINFVFPLIYAVAFWVYRGATPGKMVLGMKIISLSTGDYPSVGQSIGRYFGYILSSIPLSLGFIWAGFDARKQGWHDKLAGTVVVRKDFSTNQARVFD